MSRSGWRGWSCVPAGKFLVIRSRHVAQRKFFPLAKSKRRAEHCRADPIKGRAPDKEAAMGQDVRSPRGPRCIALVGPFQSGKTTLLEAILARTGAIHKAGSV